MIDGLRCKCKNCGTEIESTNGEGLLQKQKEHRRTCFDGFTEAKQVDDVPDPTVIF